MIFRTLRILVIICIFFIICINLIAQPYPGEEENIDFLTTFSKDISHTDNENHHIQIFFVSVPKNYEGDIYFELFDPDIQGKHDCLNGNSFNSKTKFAIYGGKGAYTNKDARKVIPGGYYKSGKHLSSSIFGVSQIYDDQWFSFGSFKAKQGEFVESLNAYIFKIVIEGLEGDDGNMYRFYISSSYFEFQPIEGVNCFAYRKSFTLNDEVNSLAHVFPYINSNITSIKQNNFNYNLDGHIRLTTKTKKSHSMECSGDENWKSSIHEITQKEQNAFIDILFISTGNAPNYLMFYVTDQNNNPVPLYSLPTGGIPIYDFKVNIIKKYMLD